MQAAFPLKDRSQGQVLFADVPCLRGMIDAALFGGMGRVLTDKPLQPTSAVLTAGDVAICGGICGASGAHLLHHALMAEKREWLVYAPGAWRNALEKMTPCHEETRIAFDHDIQPTDDRLEAILDGAPPALTFTPIEGQWFPWCMARTWSRDFVSSYPTAEAYARQGLGVLVMSGDEPVAGASSYLSYPSGIEVQVQVRDDCEGKGLATLASAALILMAHKRGRVATWDAANPASARIAEKLGYRRTMDYTVCVPDMNMDL